MRILVVEDEVNINYSICEMIKEISETDSAFTGDEAIYYAEQDIYDLIILDVMLPEKDGFVVLKQIRSFSSCPVLMLTALSDVENKVKGLEFGADDYLTKPFYRDELIARITAILRRYNNNFAGIKIRFKDLSIDTVHKIVYLNEERLNMSRKQCEILEYLIRNKDIIITREQLFNRVWGFESDTIWSVMEVYISNLRKQLKTFDYSKYLKTIRNVGYMWSEKE